MRTNATHIETKARVRNAVSPLPPTSPQEARAKRWYTGGVGSPECFRATRDCHTLGSDAISFVQSSSIHRYRPNKIHGVLMSTSTINNTRLPNAIKNISRTEAPSTNEGGDSGTVDDVADIIHTL